jgi:uncharacterized lipoprotein
MNRIGTPILLALIAFSLVGCPFFLGASMGVGTYYLVRGDLTRLYRAGYDQAWEAALVTVDEMEMTVEKEKKGEGDGKIEAKRYDGSPVTLFLKRKALDVTQLRVRVGPVGDRKKAEVVHETFREVVFR